MYLDVRWIDPLDVRLTGFALAFFVADHFFALPCVETDRTRETADLCVSFCQHDTDGQRRRRMRAPYYFQ